MICSPYALPTEPMPITGPCSQWIMALLRPPTVTTLRPRSCPPIPPLLGLPGSESSHHAPPTPLRAWGQQDQLHVSWPRLPPASWPVGAKGPTMNKTKCLSGMDLDNKLYFAHPYSRQFYISYLGFFLAAYYLADSFAPTAH